MFSHQCMDWRSYQKNLMLTFYTGESKLKHSSWRVRWNWNRFRPLLPIISLAKPNLSMISCKYQQECCNNKRHKGINDKNLIFALNLRFFCPTSFCKRLDNRSIPNSQLHSFVRWSNLVHQKINNWKKVIRGRCNQVISILHTIPVIAIRPDSLSIASNAFTRNRNGTRSPSSQNAVVLGSKFASFFFNLAML